MLKCSLALLSLSDVPELGDCCGHLASPTVREPSGEGAGGREASVQAGHAVSAIPVSRFLGAACAACGLLTGAGQ